MLRDTPIVHLFSMDGKYQRIFSEPNLERLVEVLDWDDFVLQEHLLQMLLL